jgi:hypothetical protein
MDLLYTDRTADQAVSVSYMTGSIDPYGDWIIIITYRIALNHNLEIIIGTLPMILLSG